jgi:hypothetical protein
MTKTKNVTKMSLRLPDYVREQISLTADELNVTDSEFVRISVVSALAKYARRNAPKYADMSHA